MMFTDKVDFSDKSLLVTKGHWTLGIALGLEVFDLESKFECTA